MAILEVLPGAMPAGDEPSLEDRLHAELGLSPDQRIGWLDANNVKVYLPYERHATAGHLLVEFSLEGPGEYKGGELRINNDPYTRRISGELIDDLGAIAMRKVDSDDHPMYRSDIVCNPSLDPHHPQPISFIFTQDINPVAFETAVPWAA